MRYPFRRCPRCNLPTSSGPQPTTSLKPKQATEQAPPSAVTGPLDGDLSVVDINKKKTSTYLVVRHVSDSQYPEAEIKERSIILSLVTIN